MGPSAHFIHISLIGSSINTDSSQSRLPLGWTVRGYEVVRLADMAGFRC
jgi:hypothetical protein